ncbi:MAG: transketolase [Candidatus Binatia bacterium]
MSVVTKSLDALCINTVRTLSIDAVQKANSGHPGLPLGAAPMAYVLWQKYLRHNPRNPHWPDRDRFVLSAGHGSMLLYSLLHLTGYNLTLEDIKQFRQWGSRTPGHPEYRLTPGVEATTGPLGQGFANAVGMAMAERHLARRFNRPGHVIVDHYSYALCSDGDLMEGVAAEAASLAGHLQLGKVVFLYDSNDVSLDGPTAMTFTEDVRKRFEAYGWQVLCVPDGNYDTTGIDQAIAAARADTSRPSLIIVRTTLGYGSPHKGGSYQAHGSPLGAEEVRLTKLALGWDPDSSFYVPDAAQAHFRTAVERGEQLERQWKERFAAYERTYPQLAAEWRQTMSGELPENWDEGFPVFEPGKEVATREASGKVINAIAARFGGFFGGDGDLSSSTKTLIEGEETFDGQSGAGRNVRYGVREHAMGSIANGLAYHGGVRPFAATFFVFSDYMRPAVRLAALNRLPVVFVWTHDSVALGEDGPTHQPIEQLASLRALPNLTLFRPADATETAEAWRFTMESATGPVALVLSRQKLPVLEGARQHARSGVPRGAYVLAEAEGGNPDALVIATGSEVQVALAARRLLAADGVRTRVVSMPSWDLFEIQSREYKDSVLSPSVTARVSLEAGVTLGWQRYVGASGMSIGIDRYGASAPGATNMREFGLTAEHVARSVRTLLER